MMRLAVLGRVRPKPATRLRPILVSAVILGAAAGGLLPARAAEPPPAATPAEAVPPEATPAAPATARISIVLVRELREERLPPLSLLDIAPPDDGVAGARLAISDNNTTGKFLGQEFTLDVVQSGKIDELVAETVKRVEAGAGFVVTDASPAAVIALADALKERNALIFNAGSPDETLREDQCRANVKHTAPSRTMLADALAQYLAWKRWTRWFMVKGSTPEDKAFAEALERAAKKFGSKIVETREFQYEPGSRRSDGGFEQIQQQIPSFTQKVPEHDVVVVADEGGLFGEYFPYRTWDAKPVTGTAGLYAASWHPAVELWGGTQFQNRFKRLAGRNMRELDYNVWMAVRSVGEAATRKKSGEAKMLIDYMRSPEFELAAFKGQKLTYRDWNGQLRQPVLLVTGKMMVTISPQPGFLHQVSELDTLGIDKPESKCKGLSK